MTFEETQRLLIYITTKLTKDSDEKNPAQKYGKLFKLFFGKPLSKVYC